MCVCVRVCVNELVDILKQTALIEFAFTVSTQVSNLLPPGLNHQGGVLVSVKRG